MIGVLGGTFDPVHLGHLLLAEMARESLGLQRVLFVPVGDPPHKQAQPITPGRHRRAMVELAVGNNPGFEVCLVDLERPGPHYAVDTVRLIRDRYDIPAEACYFIVGGDSLADLPGWRRPEALLRLCRLAVVHRPGHQPDLRALATQLPGIAGRLDWVKMPEIGLSGSQIRARVRARQSIRYQVSEAVQNYIQKNQLYQQRV
ncbi:MAG TPA: nicotinate-nucleotide adenylyltransferase [Nitrospiria bacterium]|nr:nicotinate-nucleotide adenylyltransferase [Nitrospiria bacterium]